MIVLRRVLRSLLLLLTATATAQQPALTVEQVLTRVRANIAEYRHTVPSFSADESITSYIQDNGRIKDRAQVESSFRITRGTDHFDETRETTAANHKRNRKGRHVHLPYKYNGAFADASGFLLDQCGSRKLATPGPSEPSKIVILFERVAPATPSSECKGLAFHGRALVDPVSFNIEQVQLEVDDTPLGVEHNPSVNIRISDQNRTLTFVACNPVRLGDMSYWLPQRVTSTLTDNTKPLTLHYEATYSNYKLFTSTVTVTPIHPAE